MVTYWGHWPASGVLCECILPELRRMKVEAVVCRGKSGLIYNPHLSCWEARRNSACSNAVVGSRSQPMSYWYQHPHSFHYAQVKQIQLSSWPNGCMLNC